MRRIVLLILVILSCSYLWAYAPAPYIRQYSSSFTVDLSSEKFMSHSVTSTYNKADSSGIQQRRDGKYYQNQELGVIGVSYVNIGENEGEAACSIMIEISVPTNGWYYRLSGSEYKRPYGLDLFARGKIFGSDTDVDLSQYCTSLGIQDTPRNLDQTSVVTYYLPKTLVANYSSVWWDMCLVMDPGVLHDDETGEDYVLIYGNKSLIQPSNSPYSTDINISISCWDFEDKDEYDACSSEDRESHLLSQQLFPIHLEGYFKPDSVISENSDTVAASVSFEKLPQADEFLMLNGNLLNTDLIWIANYDLMSSSKKKDAGENKPSESGKVYIFMSSSPEGYSTSGYFALRHTHDLNAVNTRPFVFNVIMESTKDFTGEASPLAHVNGGTSRTVTFDGTTYFNPSGGSVPSNCMVVEAELTRQKSWYARWVDSGKVSIQLTGKVLDYSNGTPQLVDCNINDFAIGEYTANIYVHIVSDIN